MYEIHFQDGSSRPVGTIFCIARNYVAHIEELNNSKPDMPVIFCKPITALNTAADIRLPTYSQDVHYETELVLQIGKGGRDIAEAEALSHIGGIAVGLDLTARDVQGKLQAKSWPWELAKGFEHAASVSEFVSADTIADWSYVNFSLHINDELRQEGDSRLMIFSIAEQIAFISRHFSLREGDLLFTGTPAGVGALASGDRLHGELEGGLISMDWRIL